jgi:Flp pilus assembly protein TadD
LQEAAVWYEQGRHDLQAGGTLDAITALRRAAAIDPGRPSYRFALADALARDGQSDAARQVLLTLRERTPEDPQVNASLARLEARRGSVAAASGYYESALYGAWMADQAAPRRQLRVEMIRYLLAHRQEQRALSQLLVLSANLPEDAGLQVEAGQLLMRAGDTRRALDHFRHALAVAPNDLSALAGAGEAAFGLEDYGRAHRYLHGIPHESDHLRRLAALAALVVRHDPLMPGLSGDERSRRLVGCLTHAAARVRSCARRADPESEPLPAGLDSLRAEALSLARGLAAGRRRRSSDVLESGTALILRIERAADAAHCPTAEVDQALSLIARKHESDRP